MRGATKLSTHISRACDVLGVFGTEFRQTLEREVLTKVLLRKAGDTVTICGSPGTGKQRTAQVCHQSAATALGRAGKFVTVHAATLETALTSQLLESADDGTLFVSNLEASNQAGQRALLELLQNKQRLDNILLIVSCHPSMEELLAKRVLCADLVDHIATRIRLTDLHERRRDIGELTEQFVLEAARELHADDFYGLSRRARADFETAIITAREASVRRLRDVVRDCVFAAAADALPEVLESDMVRQGLQDAFLFSATQRTQFDADEIEQEFAQLVGSAQLREILAAHHISQESLAELSSALRRIIDEMHDVPRSYRNIVERVNKLSKVALWMISGAKSQAEFRRYFGNMNVDMPPKSVAHQIYYEVFPAKEEAAA